MVFLATLWDRGGACHSSLRILADRSVEFRNGPLVLLLVDSLNHRGSIPLLSFSSFQVSVVNCRPKSPPKPAESTVAESPKPESETPQKEPLKPEDEAKKKEEEEQYAYRREHGVTFVQKHKFV
ncbi:hypothetical protein L596_022886 [Steinernema carpocapsae]|uniref:Uncharacterized protein n=1 Tax=Steinernema carpocapsae TaxID=34508 RepID=A0A4U5MBU9_STECR|nr:hypothetical protein L596_022886 [Steinernema carpocapsae]